jgi:acyl-CoA synthetase (AMP-forming)/AMP-acid ligase II/aryl carrier-like protein
MAGLESVFNVPVLETYSMSEALHITSNSLPPAQRKPGSVGKPAGLEVALADPTGNLLQAGEEGEILVRGDSVFRGYEDNLEANQSAFVNGWLRTGDQGYLDEEGYLFITGRIKEIINRGGASIAPQEVDDILLDHPAVEQAVTFAVPHPTLGEDMAAAVILQRGAIATEKQLRQWVSDRVGAHKIPTQVLIVDGLPTGALGKVDRDRVAESLAWKLRPTYSAPGTPIEVRLAAEWSDLLGVEQVGVDDNFFTLGGDSLRATQLVSRLRATFHVEVSLESVFAEPVLADQALLLEDLILSRIEGLTEADARKAMHSA